MPPSTEISIDLAMRRDQRRLVRWLERIEKMPPESRKRHFSAWREVWEKSVALRQGRQQAAALPVAIDQSLPIAPLADLIAETLRQHPVTIVSGEAGSGKSTQLPLIALRAGFGVAGMIGHTQPRRIAARSIATRLAEQLRAPLGSTVGFKIRFTDETSPTTLIKVMTDGVLLAEIQRDRQLENYDCLIIDEAHERSLNIDLLIGYLKHLLDRRDDLRVIITSATLDTERFAAHFGAAGHSAPTIVVPGRSYPIEVRYEPPPRADLADDPVEAAVACCLRILAQTGMEADGDILVFLATEGDIHGAAHRLRGALRDRCEILPLYARLTLPQQNAIFAPHTRRRIVLATNVAESSITVPGIRYVVDVGTARISRYAPRSKVQRLPVEPISQAAAVQRAGRCGRVGPGVCIRLYDEADFLARPLFTTPEIRRTNLAGTVLQMLALRLGDLLTFPLLDPPSPDLVRDAYQTLRELDAIDSDHQLTPRGRQMSRFPVDPRISRMILEGVERNTLAEVLIIAAALEIPDPRLRPADQQAAADRAHAAWDDPRSDFMTLLNLWDFIHSLKTKCSRSQQRKAWEQNFLSPSLIRQWSDVHRQLLAMVQEQGYPAPRRSHDYVAIHQAIACGLLSGVARRGERGEYSGAGNIKFVLWPGSSIQRAARNSRESQPTSGQSVAAARSPQAKMPSWIIAAELVETSRRYGRMVAQIEPAWLEVLAAHMTKRSLADPHWSERQETAQAFETISLFGLPIVSRRRVNYAAIDPVLSRELFIEQGLVEGKLRTSFPFLDHNRRLLDLLAKAAHKTRQRQWIVESYQWVKFYRERLPREACDVRALRQLLRQRPEIDGQLRMTETDLGLTGSLQQVAVDFPDEVAVGNLRVPVDYMFAPGDAQDGATIQIPSPSLGQLDDAQLGWLIPGLLRQRVIAAIRSLPKALRRSLVPAPAVAEQVLARIIPGTGDFWCAIARELSRIAGQTIDASQFDLAQIEPHWLVNVEVIDDERQKVASGRSLAEIQRQLGPRPLAVSVEDSPWHQDGLTDWSWGELPRSVEVTRGAIRMEMFPAMVDQQTAVGLRLSDTPERADHLSRGGLMRLFQLAKKKDVRAHVTWLPRWAECEAKLSRWMDAATLRRGIEDLLVRIALVEGKELPRHETDYRNQLANAGGKLAGAAAEIARWLPQLAEAVHQVDTRLESPVGAKAALREELRQQMAELLNRHFLTETPWEWLVCYPRYLRAIQIRWDKARAAPAGPGADAVTPLWHRYRELRALHESHGWLDPELVLARWMIEELRVSLYAQTLGTKLPVSPQRLEKQFARIRK